MQIKGIVMNTRNNNNYDIIIILIQADDNIATKLDVLRFEEVDKINVYIYTCKLIVLLHMSVFVSFI